MLQVLKSKKGFTLVELLIVVVIIGILAVTVIPRLGKSTEVARDGQRKGALNGVAGALSTYVSVKEGNPANLLPATTGCLKADLASLVSDYIGNLPADPKLFGSAKCPTGYAYEKLTDGFLITARMEAGNGDDLSGDSVICESELYDSTGWLKTKVTDVLALDDKDEAVCAVNSLFFIAQ